MKAGRFLSRLQEKPFVVKHTCFQGKTKAAGFVLRAASRFTAGGFRTQSLQLSVDLHLPLPPSVP